MNDDELSKNAEIFKYRKSDREREREQNKEKS